MFSSEWFGKDTDIRLNQCAVLEHHRIDQHLTTWCKRRSSRCFRLRGSNSYPYQPRLHICPKVVGRFMTFKMQAKTMPGVVSLGFLNDLFEIDGSAADLTVIKYKPLTYDKDKLRMFRNILYRTACTCIYLWLQKALYDNFNLRVWFIEIPQTHMSVILLFQFIQNTAWFSPNVGFNRLFPITGLADSENDWCHTLS